MHGREKHIQQKTKNKKPIEKQKQFYLTCGFAGKYVSAIHSGVRGHENSAVLCIHSTTVSLLIKISQLILVNSIKKIKKKLQGKSMNNSILDSWNILYLFYICIYTFIYIYVNTFCVAKI